MTRPHVIAVAGKGGEGKTLVSVNLAAALAREGARVLYLDLDTGMGPHNPNWGVEIPWGLGDFWERGDLTCLTRKVSVGGEGRGPHVEILGGHAEYLPEKADPQRLGDAMAKGGWTHILMDLGAGTKRQVFRFCALADELVLVSGGHPNALRETVDIAGTALGLKRDLRFLFLPNRCDPATLPAVHEQLRRAMGTKFVQLNHGDRPEQGFLAQYISEKTGNLVFLDGVIPEFSNFLPDSKRLSPGSRDLAFFKELATKVLAWKPTRRLDIGSLLTRLLRTKGMHAGGIPERDSGVERYRDFFRRMEARPELMKAFSRTRVFTSAKGGVGQTEALARLAYGGAGSIPQILFDLNMEETSRHSSLGWYYGLRAPVAVRTLWEKEGHTWPLDRKKKMEIFFYRNRQGVESSQSFLEALSERMVEQLGGNKERRAWLDGESGLESPVMVLGILSGHITVMSDSRDRESEWKLIHWVREWHRAVEAFSRPGSSLRIILTRCPRESAGAMNRRKSELLKALEMEPRRASGQEVRVPPSPSAQSPGMSGTRLNLSPENIYLFTEHSPMDGGWSGFALSAEEKRLMNDLWKDEGPGKRAKAGVSSAGKGEGKKK